MPRRIHPAPSADWNDLSVEEAASLFGSAPPRGVPEQDEPVPPSGRMRSAARRRARDRTGDAALVPEAEQAGTAGVPEELATPPAPPRALIPPNPDPNTTGAPGVHSLVAMQRDVLRGIYSDLGITRESFCKEVLATARLATADSDYTAAANLYKIIGQHIGALTSTENHLHVHQAPPGTSGAPAVDHRATPDEALRALIQRAKAQETVKDAEPAPIVDALPAPMGDEPTDE